MARRRGRRPNRRSRKKESPIVVLIIAMFTLTAFVLRLILFILTFTYEFITFNTSGYKEKTNVGFLRTYFNKGNYGEFSFYRKLTRIINKENIFVNLYLDNINTEFTEVDMIAISTNGVYVFEVKNYSGYIFGSQNDKYWTQTFHKNSKFQFYNPLRQNYAHVKAVERILNVPESQIIPIITFSNKSKLRKLNITKETHVYHFKDALKIVKNYVKNSRNLITEEEIIEYQKTIPSFTHASEIIRKRHVEGITEHIENLNPLEK